uniref:Uncharacterized protein n=1 Tax=Cucumis melo TaxID=3656 RepID=A0A9I9EKF2_CUCME
MASVSSSVSFSVFICLSIGRRTQIKIEKSLKFKLQFTAHSSTLYMGNPLNHLYTRIVASLR